MQLLALAAYIAGASALGINCRGSGMCLVGAQMTDVQSQIGDMIASGNGDRWFNTGDQIACAKGQEFDSTCAFFQKGASGTAQQAFDHIQNLLDHGCGTCGSDPTEDGNDVSTGELTVNAVHNPCCKGDCQC
ncbi:hypothetical protein SEPCBS119000_004087 [Sporothrix epigloea]|uniref:Killer toxin Kp4 domain-containing protein n=1 Tax=Sporothrix epigloea TaxID=1892477 RepID=A0ABP0DRG7_9PEZI